MTPVVDSVLNVALEVTTVNVAIPPCYLCPMPNLATRTVGDGPKRTIVWIEGVPVIDAAPGRG